MKDNSYLHHKTKKIKCQEISKSITKYYCSKKNIFLTRLHSIVPIQCRNCKSKILYNFVNEGTEEFFCPFYYIDKIVNNERNLNV